MIAGRIALCVVLTWCSEQAAGQEKSHRRPAGAYPVKTFVGLARPALLDLVFDPAHTDARLVLLDDDGGCRADLRGVRPGRIDLAEHDADLWTRSSAVAAQLLLLDVAVGTPVIIEPMRTRQVPLVSREIHPETGAWHTKIVGWADEGSIEVASPETFDEAGERAAGTDDEAIVSGVRLHLARDVVLDTSEGPIRFAMAYAAAPNTARNFVELAAGGFYDHVPFHRIVPFDRRGRPFVVQGGDPSGTGEGGPGYWLPLERSTLAHDYGVVSMARSDDPDSAGSQFFICLSRDGTARLDGQYCAFGFAVTGSDTLQRLAETPLRDAATGRPVHPPVIHSAHVIPAPPRRPGHSRLDDRIGAEQATPPESAGDDEDDGRVGR